MPRKERRKQDDGTPRYLVYKPKTVATATSIIGLGFQVNHSPYDARWDHSPSLYRDDLKLPVERLRYLIAPVSYQFCRRRK